MPDIPITFFTDQDCLELFPFDKIIRIPSVIDHPVLRNREAYPEQGYMAKVLYMGKAEYDSCLFLDYDTVLIESVYEIFEMLENGVDIAACHETGSKSCKWAYPDVPDCFATPNSGVVGYHRSEIMAEFFQHYWKLMEDQGIAGIGSADQVTLRKALWDYRDRITYVTLMKEYNCRFIFPNLMWSQVKILHGRHEHISQVAIFHSGKEGYERVSINDQLIATYQPSIGFTKY